MRSGRALEFRRAGVTLVPSRRTRPAGATRERDVRIRELHAAGCSARQIAVEVKLGKSAVAKVISRSTTPITSTAFRWRHELRRSWNCEAEPSRPRTHPAA